METNTYKAFRIRFIEGCLRNKLRKYRKSDILFELNDELDDTKKISESTLNQDLSYIAKELAEYGRKIVMTKEGKVCYYRYDDTAFSLFEEKIAAQDVKKLADAILLLKSIKGIDQNNKLTNILNQLDTQVKYIKQPTLAISIGEAIYANGYEYVDELYEAILQNTALHIVYKPFTNEVRSIIIHPYHLRQYNNRWYLFGFDELKESIVSLALDRFQKNPQPLSNPYKSPEGVFDAGYFKDIIGITRYKDASIETVKLWFSASRAPYITTRPLHHSQLVEKSNDGSILVTIEVIPNFELEQLILSYGKDVIVELPLVLKESIKAEITKSFKNYTH